MLTQTVFNKENKEIKKVELKESIFGAKFKRQLLFDCVNVYLSNKRQGTAKAKSRGEVSGSTIKIYRQKGTGRARHGDIKAPIFVGGGIAFPPRPRDWRLELPKKMKRKALAQALALRYSEGNLFLVDQISSETIKTKRIAEQLNKWKVEEGLIIVEKPDEKLFKSLRNIPRIRLVTSEGVNALDVLSSGKVVLTEKALHQLEKRLI